jgi:hypothetical protein
MELAEILKVMKEVTGSEPIQICNRDQIPKNTPYIYIVYNGENVLQIGKTKGGDNGGRLVSLINGARPSIHNKSFIVGLASAVFGNKNEYCLFRIVKNTNVEDAEKQIHNKLGVETNSNACVFFEGTHCKSMKEANKYLWDKFLQSNDYTLLERNEKVMAKELFEIVDSCKVEVIRGTGRSQPYSSGDILTGNIICSLGVHSFTNLWQKICKSYFVYTDYYRLSENEYTKEVENYKTIFTEQARSSGVLRNSSQPAIRQNTINQVHDVDSLILDLDIVIRMEQLEKAKAILETNQIIYNECKTRDMIFETNHPHYILLITTPTKSDSKIDEFLSRFDNNNEIILSNLAKTNKTEKRQFFTNVGSCYIEYRARGFRCDSPRYIPYI